MNFSHRYSLASFLTLLLTVSSCTFLESSNIKNDSLAVSGNVIFMLPTIKVLSGNYDYQACESDVTLVADVYTAQTEVAQYHWEVIPYLDYTGPNTQVLPLNSCPEIHNSDYTGSSPRSGNSKTFTLNQIQVQNDFFVKLTVTDTKGRTASSYMIFAATEHNIDSSIVRDNVTGAIIISPHPLVKIEQNKITINSKNPYQTLQLSTNGDSLVQGIYESITTTGAAADWDNTGDYEGLPQSTEKQILSHDFITNGDHSGKFTMMNSPGLETLAEVSYIYITQ